MMKRGDKVFVFPAGDARQGLHVLVELASKSNDSLALVLGEQRPPWGIADGFAVHPSLGRVLVLLRDETTRPFWKDIFTGHHYGISIEEVPA